MILKYAHVIVLSLLNYSCLGFCPATSLSLVSPTSRLFADFYEDEFEGMGSEEAIQQERLSDEELAATMGEWDDKIARFNTVHLVGRVGQDPEAKYLDGGKVVVNISLACRRKYHNAERGEMKIKSGDEETDWYGLEIWGQTAEFVSKYVEKGSRVGVIGSLQIDGWADKETGEPRERAKVIVRDFDILETRAEADLRRGGGGRNRKSFAINDDEDDTSPAGTGGFFSDM